MERFSAVDVSRFEVSWFVETHHEALRIKNSITTLKHQMSQTQHIVSLRRNVIFCSRLNGGIIGGSHLFGCIAFDLFFLLRQQILVTNKRFLTSV